MQEERKPDVSPAGAATVTILRPVVRASLDRAGKVEWFGRMADDRPLDRPWVRDLVEAARELETGCPDRGRELLVRALDDGWPRWREWW